MIEIKNLVKKFDGKTLFDNYTTGFEGPGLYFITGKIGAGKTTLLNMIGGLESFDDGEILIDNAPVQKNNNETLWKKITFLFPYDSLVDEHTISYNLNIGLTKKADKRDKIVALKDVGLPEHLLKNKVASLNEAEKQLVALARAILRDTKYIFADEPTSMLDKDSTKKLMELFQNLSNHKIIIITTYDTSIVKYGKGRIVL